MSPLRASELLTFDPRGVLTVVRDVSYLSSDPGCTVPLEGGVAAIGPATAITQCIVPQSVRDNYALSRADSGDASSGTPRRISGPQSTSRHDSALTRMSRAPPLCSHTALPHETATLQSRSGDSERARCPEHCACRDGWSDSTASPRCSMRICAANWPARAGRPPTAWASALSMS